MDRLPDEPPQFRPQRLIAGPVAQTLLAAFLPRRSSAFLDRSEIREVQADETTRARIEVDRPNGAPRAAIVLLHGLAGSARSNYVVGFARRAVERGFLVARVNARNCGDTEELTADPYNGEETRDAEAAARSVVEIDGARHVHFVGFSVGGNQILRLAGGYGDAPPAWAASFSVLSPCIDFALAADHLEKGVFQRACARYFIGQLKRIVRRRHELGDPRIELEGLDAIRTIRAFDDRYTAPLSGYHDADAYYTGASSRTRLAPIRVPTLMLTARDDPLVPYASFEDLELGGAPIELVSTNQGGHVAFLGASEQADSGPRWAENRVLDFAEGCEGE